MARGKSTLSAEQEREVIALYTAPDQSLRELKATYAISDGILYGILKRHGVALRSPQRAHSHFPEPLPLPEPEPTVRTAHPLAISVDKNGLVEHVERVTSGSKQYVWEVRFESAMRVEAASIIDAVEQTLRMPMCRRVISATLKGGA